VSASLTNVAVTSSLRWMFNVITFMIYLCKTCHLLTVGGWVADTGMVSRPRTRTALSRPCWRRCTTRRRPGKAGHWHPQRQRVCHMLVTTCCHRWVPCYMTSASAAHLAGVCCHWACGGGGAGPDVGWGVMGVVPGLLFCLMFRSRAAGVPEAAVLAQGLDALLDKTTIVSPELLMRRGEQQ